VEQLRTLVWPLRLVLPLTLSLTLPLVRPQLLEISPGPQGGAQLLLKVCSREAVADFADAKAVRGEVEDGDGTDESRELESFVARRAEE
jgi:hypothetical protein